MAQAPCTPVNIAPPTDPALLIFEVEGKIQSYNTTNRTISANGMTIFIPTTVLVETRNLDLTGNITFANLTDARLEAQRSIIGGTVIASGDIVFSQGASGSCVSMNATRVFVEFAENGIVGLLSDVDSAAGTFPVNGTLVRMNADSRFPKDILDVGGNPLTISELVSHAGEAISVGGYYDAAQMCSLARSWKPSLSKPYPVRMAFLLPGPKVERATVSFVWSALSRPSVHRRSRRDHPQLTLFPRRGSKRSASAANPRFNFSLPKISFASLCTKGPL